MGAIERAEQVSEALGNITGETYLEMSLGSAKVKLQVRHAEVRRDATTGQVWVQAVIVTVGEPEMLAEPTGGWK